MEYAVVIFIDTNTVALVSKTWYDGNKCCLWPNYKDSTRINAAVRKHEKPKDNWRSYPIRELLTEKNYMKALTKTDDALETSDLQTAESDEAESPVRLKRRRKPNSRYVENQMEDVGDDDEFHFRSVGKKPHHSGSSQLVPAVQLPIPPTQDVPNERPSSPPSTLIDRAPFSWTLTSVSTPSTSTRSEECPNLGPGFSPPSTLTDRAPFSRTLTSVSTPSTSTRSEECPNLGPGFSPPSTLTDRAPFSRTLTSVSTPSTSTRSEECPNLGPGFSPPSTLTDRAPFSRTLTSVSTPSTSTRYEECPNLGPGFSPPSTLTDRAPFSRTLTSVSTPSTSTRSEECPNLGPGFSPPSTLTDRAPSSSTHHSRHSTYMSARDLQIFTAIEEMKVAIRSVHEVQKQILRHVQMVDVTNHQDLPEDIQLPLQRMEAVDELEQRLQDPVVERTLQRQLCHIGGVSAKDTTRRVLKQLVSDSLALQFSWKGMQGKRAFQDLKLKKIMMKALRQNPDTKNVPSFDLEKAASDWFRYAKDRSGGRKKRMEKTQTNN